MKLTNRSGGTYTPMPVGIHNCICVDLIDLGIQATEFGDKHRLKLVFESSLQKEDGSPMYITKTFNASLHPKASLSEFLSKWRGAAFKDGETFDLELLLGVCATLVISHETNGEGKTYATIDTVIKPTAASKIEASGTYDPAAARQRIAQYANKVSSPAQSQDRFAGVMTNFPAAPAPAPAEFRVLTPAKAKAVKVKPEPSEDDVPF